MQTRILLTTAKCKSEGLATFNIKRATLDDFKPKESLKEQEYFSSADNKALLFFLLIND